MCTLTWHDTADGYRVFFNRDERHERKPEIPPARRRAGDTRFVAALDGDHHGTWIAANEFGLSVCLLNGFAASRIAPRGRYTTRGSLPLTAVAERSSAAIERWLCACDLASFRPFLMVVFEPAGRGLTAHWTGEGLDLRDGRPPAQPLVSSSFFSEQVRASRTAVFERLVGAGGGPAAAHVAFHRSHLPARGPHSPCMHRDDARTVSFTRVDVDARSVRLHYTPDSPCRGVPEGPALVLERPAAG